MLISKQHAGRLLVAWWLQTVGKILGVFLKLETVRELAELH